MWNMLRCEINKLLRCKALYVLLLASAALGVLSVWLTFNGNPGGISESYSAQLELMKMGYYAYASAIGDCGIEIVICALFAGIFICSDFENRTISLAVTAGNSRAAVLLGKAGAFYLAVAVLVLPYPLISGAAATIIGGFGTAVTGAVVMGMVRMLLFKVLISAAMMTVCIPLCFLLKKSGTSAAAGILVLLAGQTALSIRTGDGGGIVDTIYRYSPIGLLATVSNPVITTGEGLTALAASAALILIMLGAAWMAFRKMELK